MAVASYPISLFSTSSEILFLFDLWETPFLRSKVIFIFVGPAFSRDIRASRTGQESPPEEASLIALQPANTVVDASSAGHTFGETYSNACQAYFISSVTQIKLRIA